jgi:hypothetical protein
MVDIPGSSYLYALATLSITFSGFSALITMLRQTSGGTLSRYDTFLMVNYFSTGFAIAILCLLPPLLSGWSANYDVIWRVPSAAALCFGVTVEVVAISRRRRATGESTPLFVIILLLSYWPAFLLLLLSALGIGVQPGFGPFAASLTWIFAMAAIDYTMALGILFGGHT